MTLSQMCKRSEYTRALRDHYGSRLPARVIEDQADQHGMTPADLVEAGLIIKKDGSCSTLDFVLTIGY